jgi:galactoside O-acetyltransferase
MAFLPENVLRSIGFKYLGNNVKLSDKASIYNAGAISIGDNTRIDDFCILSAGVNGITLGRHIHITCYSMMMGQGRIIMENFSGLSSRVAIYSSSDDYSGVAMANPTVPIEFTNGTRRLNSRCLNEVSIPDLL